MSAKNIGSKRLVVGAHYGTFGFIAQRVTAIVMALYTIYLLIAMLVTPAFTYESWTRVFNFHIFNFPMGRALALLAFLSLAYHAWIGVRDIWMDYVRHTGIRLVLQVLTVLWLVASVAYAAQILWSI